MIVRDHLLKFDKEFSFKALGGVAVAEGEQDADVSREMIH